MTFPRGTAALINGLVALLLILGGQVLLPAAPVQAAAATTPPGPDRITPITIDYTAYTWWMADYDTNKVACSIIVDHEGQPTLGDIYKNCDFNVYFDFKEQPPCYVPSHKQNCEGYYLYLVDTQQAQREITDEVNREEPPADKPDKPGTPGA